MLGLPRTRDALAAFRRALGKREGVEHQQLCQSESKRLDDLETRIRTRDVDDPAKLERRLAALEKLRETIR
jgi:hypothetical protein